MTPLIDATEMYLRTIWELEEEGITPIRARIVERLGLSAPAVSETVGRLETEGLVHLADDRTLELSEEGRRIAQSVMRKHRLAERLLTDVIGLDWGLVHNEACRWEHVISDAVERRLVAILGSPTACPHGNPIPGLSQDGGAEAGSTELVSLTQAARAGGRATVRRISEKLQSDVEVMELFDAKGLHPGAEVSVGHDGLGVAVTVVARADGGGPAGSGAAFALDEDAAALVYVTAPAGAGAVTVGADAGMAGRG